MAPSLYVHQRLHLEVLWLYGYRFVTATILAPTTYAATTSKDPPTTCPASAAPAPWASRVSSQWLKNKWSSPTSIITVIITVIIVVSRMLHWERSKTDSNINSNKYTMH